MYPAFLSGVALRYTVVHADDGETLVVDTNAGMNYFAGTRVSWEIEDKTVKDPRFPDSYVLHAPRFRFCHQYVMFYPHCTNGWATKASKMNIL